MTFYDMGGDRLKFDVTVRPYCAVCEAQGCPQRTALFCNTDDCCNGDMHPELRRNRTPTIGRGGQICNFGIAVREKSP